MQTYNIDDISLGDRSKSDKIVFQTIDEMKKAYQDIDNGKDIYVRDKEGTVIFLLNRMINAKIANGSIMICANAGGDLK